MRRKCHGFTLVEMLVVVLIIGVLLGITLMTPMTGNAHRVAKEQATRLQLLFSQVRDKALLENAEFGFSVDDDGTYRWWVLPLEGKNWVMIEEKPFQPFQMPESYNIELETGEQESFDSNEIDEKDRPSVVFFSDRESTPFKLSIIPASDQKLSVILRSDGLSDVEISRE
ncbi:MAG: type II secretion system minor pseudopilin GspH [Candidatus Endonucleobacter bathymodioli]|uniref:Type II secretion system protein H n=1 Tax=Candidatus Endonucleibacter bathymodioli TaxID=539814 RepID=A0AA90SCW7_9GAMM|nr:type II secretion system minor pseudopilin GspH [Candidatus Endonucleobacter bathymodioli]